jgi:hypothetical protein
MTASTPYGRLAGGWMNSTPRAASSAWSPAQSVVDITPGLSAPLATSARTWLAVSASSMDRAGSISSRSWPPPGGRTVSQRMPLSSSISVVTVQPSFVV